MTGQVLVVAPGARLLFDGDVVEVLELAGTRVTLRNTRTDAMVIVGLTRLVSAASSLVDVAADRTKRCGWFWPNGLASPVGREALNEPARPW